MHESSPFPRTLRIGILVFDNFEPIDVWGFIQAFSIARFIGTSYFGDPPYPFEVVLISNQRKPGSKGEAPAPVKSFNGPRVAPDFFRDEALEEKIDLLMIPGGAGVYALLGDDHPAEKRELLQWVRSMDERVTLMTSVCTGAAILAAAGVLDRQLQHAVARRARDPHRRGAGFPQFPPSQALPDRRGLGEPGLQRGPREPGPDVAGHAAGQRALVVHAHAHGGLQIPQAAARSSYRSSSTPRFSSRLRNTSISLTV